MYTCYMRNSVQSTAVCFKYVVQYLTEKYLHDLVRISVSLEISLSHHTATNLINPGYCLAASVCVCVCVCQSDAWMHSHFCMCLCVF